jgi:hypothetical protein
MAQINLQVDLAGLTNLGISALEERLNNTTSRIVQEAARIEEAERAPGSVVVEITRNHVVEADEYFRRSGVESRRPSRMDAAMSVFSALSSAVASGTGSALHSA